MCSLNLLFGSALLRRTRYPSPPCSAEGGDSRDFVEEQLRGRLAQIAEAKDAAKQSVAYQRLVETVLLLSEFQILPYDEKSQEYYRGLKTQRIRIGTQDLRIASIALAHNGVLLTRNLRDFEKIPGLSIQDWSI
jgi:tRNA(fMet)-specific endonuclease VapC